MSKTADSIYCPFCLKRFGLDDANSADQKIQCPACDLYLPRLYIQEGLVSPTDMVMSIGRTGNGKTTLLMSMFGTLINSPGLLATAVGTYAPPTTDETTSVTSWARQAYAAFSTRGVLPDTSPPIARPVPLYVIDPPQGDRRNLFLFDAGGEVFSDVATLAHNMPYTAQARVLWIVVSLGRDSWETAMEERFSGLGGNLWALLDTYVSARAEIRADLHLAPTPQALLVIFTKADNHGGRVPGIDAHLQRGAVSSPEERIALSDFLQGWLTNETQGGQGAVAKADAEFDLVEYCAVSATGGRVVPDKEGFRTMVRPQPKLILDPMAWTWELTERLNDRSSFLKRLLRRERPRAWIRAKAGRTTLPAPRSQG
ncbi:MAG: hypothetical protein M0Z88_09630 [Actinomycetota bacterium]|nr:hypothetical protein [Actinomycetota bacterium]